MKKILKWLSDNQDKQLHFLWFFMGSTVLLTRINPIVVFAGALIVAALKELRDIQLSVGHPTYEDESMKDLIASGVGSLAAIIIWLL